MASASTPTLRSFAAAAESTAISPFLPISKPPSTFLSFSSSYSSKPLLLSLSISTSLLLHSTKRHHRNIGLFTPFVASQTSDWVPQQDEEEEGQGEEEGQADLAWEEEEEKGDDQEEEPLGQEAGEDQWADGPVTAQGGEVGFGGGGGGGLFVEPNEEAKLFIGNLPYDMDTDGLAQLFDQAGVVEVAEVIYNRGSDQSRGFGFVTMSTVEEAEKAIEMFNRFDVNGRLLTVNKAAPRGSRPERGPREFAASFRLYVGNLAWQVDDARLEQVFSEHGKVVDARVVMDRETGRSRGFGFVTMASKEELDDAIAGLDGQNLDGRALRVNVAEERPRRGF